MIKIKIEAEPVPLNRAYPTNRQGRRFLSKEGSDYKRLISIATRNAFLNQGFTFNPETQYISTEFFFYSPKLFTKQHKLNKKKPDTSNLIKLLEDAIFETLGIDDCYNLDFSANYSYSEKSIIVVILRTHHLSNKFDVLLNDLEN
jgi:Holliday junction resolvase RusA-like endonuclease